MGLAVSGVCVDVGGKRILDSVTLDVAKGELIALLGPSGCGKSTFLRSIAGLVPLAAGSMRLSKRDIGLEPPQTRGIGMVFQNYALFPNLSVAENIKFGLKARATSDAVAEQRATELLDLIELAEHREKRPRQLSGGQQQRVALARALAPSPGLLLLDEPFGALDESLRLPLRRGFREIQRRLGQTCIFVTHDREEAFELADRVAVMFGGRIVQVDAPRKLWSSPVNRQLADFLGAFNVVSAAGGLGGLALRGGYYLIAPGDIRLEEAGAKSASRIEFSAVVRSVVETIKSCEIQLTIAGLAEAATWYLPLEAASPSAGQKIVCSVDRDKIQWVAD